MTTSPPETPPRRGTRLLALFVDRPVLTVMLTASLLLLGVASFLKVPLRFAPEGLTDNEINLWIPVEEERTPREVEDKVVEPLEELLRTIPGVRRLQSAAHADYAWLEIRLDGTLDLTLATAEVRDRVQRARLRWPADVDRYYAWREDASTLPLAFFQMLTPDRTPDWDFLIDKVVRPRLEAVDGVGRIEVWGLLDETIRIWFDRDKLVAHRVDYRELLERLASDNFTEPAGELDDGQRRFLLRVDNKFDSLAEIERFPVRAGLTIADVARVERVPSVRNQLSRYNQRYTYTGIVYGAAGTNPVDASRRLHVEVDRLHDDDRLSQLEFRFLFDQGAMITESLETLVTTLVQGAALALVVLYLMLRNVRYTLTIAAAIPLALLAVGGWLYFFGDSLNILTMAGMTLAVGMVVDNSIVVLENVRRLRDLGQPLREACIDGAREVGLAVSLATLTTVVVILPMVFMGDPQARISLGAVGIPLSVALVASLGVALVLLPSGARHFCGGAARAANAAAAVAAPSRWSPVAWLLRLNQALLRVSFRHRFVASLAALALLGTCQLPWNWMDFGPGGGDLFRRGDVSVNLELPRGLDLADVEQEILAYEEFVLAHKQEWRVDSVSSRFDRRSATIDIGFDRELSRKEFSAYRGRIEAAWPRRPGVEVKLSDSDSEMRGGPSEDKERGFTMRLFGRSSEHLMRLALGVRAALAKRPEIAKIESPGLDDNEEVAVRLDRDRMQQLAVGSQAMYGAAVAGLQGSVLTQFEEEGRETRIVAEFDRGNRNPTLLDLKEARVFSDRGAFQELASMADFRLERSLGTIERVEGRTHVSLIGRRADGVGPAQLSRALHGVMGSFPLPRGTSWEEESGLRDTEEDVSELMGALYLSITLVFLLMGVLFESVILPGAILFTIPFGMLGAVWSLYALVGELDPMAVVGMILLAGIVVNNGIVLLDCIARLRRGGMDREHAILEGTRRRLRPILMTASTTIVGLLPMALFGESSDQGLSYVSMSVTVAGGLAFCTVFTAFVVPLAYTFMDDLVSWLHAVWARAVRGR